MRVFACPRCTTWVEFEDRVCLTCGCALAYEPELDAIVPADDRSLCASREEIGCSWVAADPATGSPSGGPRRGDGACASCRLTSDRPPREDLAAVSQLAVAEFAKRRLLRQLRHLGLPAPTPGDTRPLAFRLLAPVDGEHVITGHADGVITINLMESNDPHREALRISLGEPYRTMLGHLRHEIGHYYWLVLVQGTAALDRFRAVFGDERQDYGTALDSHYADGPAEGGPEEHISHYATMHPWEDFAETFAHYLHIADVLETAGAMGVTVAGPHGVPEPLAGSIRSSGATTIADLPVVDVLARWHGFSLTLNAITRSMGTQDLYPFVITPGVAEKLDVVHGLLGGAAAHPGAEQGAR